jgi:hypothetical protein
MVAMAYLLGTVRWFNNPGGWSPSSQRVWRGRDAFAVQDKQNRFFEIPIVNDTAIEARRKAA